MKVNCKVLLLTVLAFFLCIDAAAQGGAHNAYSPYSVYGVGDISKEGSAYNRSMGGVGIAARNRRVINFTNPAAVTARDSLSFMADFGVIENNKVFNQTTASGKFKSANNTFNISDFVLSFPIWRSSAFMVGITPFSDVGYDFTSYETDPDIIGKTGNITYQSYGQGGVYQFFVGAGATFWKRLSLGAEMIYYFGTIDKVSNTVYTDESYRAINSGYTMQLRGVTGKFGVQYDQKLGSDLSLTLGATYRLSTKMGGYANVYRFATASEVSDTLIFRTDTLRNSGKLRFGDELGVGISLRSGENWSVEFDYLRSDWRNSGFDSYQGTMVEGSSSTFRSTVSQSFRAGFEYTPNRNDIRYYMKKVSYRGGLYYDQQYYLLDPSGRRVDAIGITLGMTFPVFKGNNGITVGLDFGRKGNFKDRSMVGEHYATIFVGMNLHDIWFQKTMYK